MKIDEFCKFGFRGDVIGRFFGADIYDWVSDLTDIYDFDGISKIDREISDEVILLASDEMQRAGLAMTYRFRTWKTLSY